MGKDFAVVGWNTNFGPNRPDRSAWGMSLDTDGNFDPGNQWCVEDTYDMHEYSVRFDVDEQAVDRDRKDVKMYDYPLDVFDNKPEVTVLCP